MSSPFQRYNIYLEEVLDTKKRKQVVTKLKNMGVFTDSYIQVPKDSICTINCTPSFLGKVVSALIDDFGFAMVELDKLHRYDRK